MFTYDYMHDYNMTDKDLLITLVLFPGMNHGCISKLVRIKYNTYVIMYYYIF